VDVVVVINDVIIFEVISVKVDSVVVVDDSNHGVVNEFIIVVVDEFITVIVDVEDCSLAYLGGNDGFE
jgi:hypothetical protein